MRTLRPNHAARVEYASADGSTGAEQCVAIRRAIAELERRGVNTHGLSFRTRRLPSGELVAEPRMTIGAALRRTRERRLRDQKNAF